MSFTKRKFELISKKSRFNKLIYYIKEFIDKLEPFLIDFVSEKDTLSYFQKDPFNFNIDISIFNKDLNILQLIKVINNPELEDIFEKLNLSIKWINEIDGLNLSIPLNIYDLKIYYHNLLNNILDNFYDEKNLFDSNNADKKEFEIFVVLDNIRSPFNVGSIIRTSESFGVKKIILVGITPKIEHPKVKRVSMKSEVENIFFENEIEAINYIKKEGYKIVAVEKTNKSIDYRDFYIEKPSFIFGNEEFGVSPEILKIADSIIYIPLYGKKNSLNVSVAAGIILSNYVNLKINNNNWFKTIILKNK